MRSSERSITARADGDTRMSDDDLQEISLTLTLTLARDSHLRIPKMSSSTLLCCCPSHTANWKIDYNYLCYYCRSCHGWYSDIYNPLYWLPDRPDRYQESVSIDHPKVITGDWVLQEAPHLQVAERFMDECFLDLNKSIKTLKFSGELCAVPNIMVKNS
jgi:hypothetical protein